MNEKWRDSGEVTLDKYPAGAGFQVLLEGIGLVVVFKPELEIRSKKDKWFS
jgi:hypothetical protein